MEASRSVDGVSYVPFRPMAIDRAVGQGWGATLGVISPPGAVELPAPIFAHHLAFQFAWWGAMFFGGGAQAASGAFPALTINGFRHASLVGQDGLVHLSNGVELEYHLVFLQWFREGSLLRRIDDKLWRPDIQGPARPGRYLLGHTPVWTNYAHWLTDTMPLWVYYAAHLKPQGVKLIVPPLSAVQAECLHLLGIVEADLHHAAREVACFEDLLVASQISLWSPPSLMRDAARALARRVMGGAVVAPRRRLYFSRRDATKRQLVNEAAVEAVLVRHGFEVVCCSELNFARQIAAAASAEIVVGTHGAALANTIFCSPGCAIIELFPEYCVQPEFRAIAARSGCAYGYVIGTSFDRENSHATQNSWDADFVLDIAAVERALDAALAYLARG